MLWRLALAALAPLDREPESINGGIVTRVLCVIMPAVCRADELSVLGAMLLDDSLDSTEMHTDILVTATQICTTVILYDPSSI